MTKLFTYQEKHAGDPLTHDEWNHLAQDVDAAVDAITNIQNNGGVGGGSSIVSATDVTESGDDDHKAAITITSGVTDVPATTVLELTEKDDKGVNVSLVGNNNINIEPREAIGDGSGKNKVSDSNRKGGNIALKPGDDIEFWAHHRGSSKNDEVSVKIMTEVPKASDPTKTDEVAAKLQLNAGDIVLTSKDKVEESDVMNITVNKAANTRGYLKVRAQAIDLRCENTPGGIALQPNGVDSDGHMNKIKFEHGGGDGLEFGTFNTEHTSLFTEDYRFNKDGEIKLATRKKIYSDKTLSFEFSNSGESSSPIATQYSVTQNGAQITAPQNITSESKYSMTEIAEMFAGLDIMAFQNWYETNKPVTIDILCDGGTHFFFAATLSLKSYGPGDTSTHYEYLKNSEDDLYDFVNSNNPTCTWEDVVNTANHITTYKRDDQNNIIDGGVLKVKGINNSTTNTLTITTANPSDGTVQDYIIPTAFNIYTPQTIASCSINDIIMFVNWAKGTGFGPWSSQAIANKEELFWDGSEFSATVQGTPSENPTVG